MEEETNNSKDVEEWINLASMAADEGDTDKAREFLLTAVEIDPECVQAWNYLSYFAGSRDEEIFALEKVLELQAGNQNAKGRLRKVESNTF